MIFLRFQVILVLLSTISYCVARHHESLVKQLKRTKRDTDLQIIDDFPVQMNCSLIFNTKLERHETIRRGYYMSKLTIMGKVIRISDIPASDYCEGRILVIELYATDAIIFDKDYDSRGLDVTLVTAAPTWHIIGQNRKIILNGRNGIKRGSPKRYENSTDGADGKQGETGGNGGYFFGFGCEFLWQNDNGEIVNKVNQEKKDYPLCYFKTDEYLEYFICPYFTDFVRAFSTGGVEAQNEKPETNFTLKIYVNGGDGANGQDGGDGTKGESGTSFTVDKSLIDQNGFVEGFDTILHKHVDPPADEPQLGKGINEVILGKIATIGSLGGNAGPGGLGGQAGGVVILSVYGISCYAYTQLSGNASLPIVRGNAGKAGKSGHFGLGNSEGHPGRDVRLSIYSSPNKSIELRNLEYYPHKNSHSSSSFDNWSVSKPETSSKLNYVFYKYSDAIDTYRGFVFANLANTPNGIIQRIIYENTYCYTSAA